MTCAAPKKKKRKSRNLPTGEDVLCALADIALGRCAYPETEKNGEVTDRLPTIAERMKGLEQLCRWVHLPETGAGDDAAVLKLAGELDDYAG